MRLVSLVVDACIDDERTQRTIAIILEWVIGKMSAGRIA